MIVLRTGLVGDCLRSCSSISSSVTSRSLVSLEIQEEVRRGGREEKRRGWEEGRRREEEGEEGTGRSFTLVEMPYRLHAPPLCQSTSCHCMSAEVKVPVTILCREREREGKKKVLSQSQQ